MSKGKLTQIIQNTWKKEGSTFGYVFTLDGGIVSWQSQLYDFVTQSIIEASYVAIFEACKEVIWLDQIVTYLGIAQKMLVLNCDSQSAI